MSWLTDTIAGRTILVLVLGIGTVLALSHAAYEYVLSRESNQQNVQRLAERLVFLKHAITRLPDSERDDAAHSMSGGPIEVHWSLEPLATPGGNTALPSGDFRQALIAAAPEIAEHGLVIGASQAVSTSHTHQKAADHDHTLLVSMQMEDQSWVNLSQVVLRGSRLSSPSFWISGLVLAIGTILVSILMAVWLTQPLSRLTVTAGRLFSGADKVEIPQGGPREIRELSIAFRDMRDRIKRLISDRTQTLAAISHDLRTPLTRLRLRMESIPDDSVRASVSADLQDMEEMIESTLLFLKGESGDEPVQTLDLVTVLDSITGDIADEGGNAIITGDRSAIILGRRLALKRAFGNILSNAIKYGNAARTHVQVEAGNALITIEDDGPGIPESEHDRVFEPFYRLEGSRGKETGGYGLGLTVARTTIQAHGGTIQLSNRAPRGLTVAIALPVSGITTAKH